MNILIVSQCFYPDIYAVSDVVNGLTRRGHQVTVLTGLPDYTTSKIPKEYKYGKNRKQKIFGADVHRVPTIARRHGPVWRSLNYISFAVTGSIAALLGKWKPFDVIYVWEVSPVTMAIPAIVLKRRYRKPLFLYCMDLWPESIKAMGFREGTFFYRIVHRLSRWIYRQCDHIAVSSTPFVGYLTDINQCDPKRISYLPQFASSELLKQDFTKEPDGHVDFIYVGNIGKVQDIDCLIYAIADLQFRRDVTFHIIGNGSEYAHAVELARQTGAAQIIQFYGSMPFSQALACYKKADACILTLDGSSHIGDTLPGKLQTYMAIGKPVFGALNGAGYEIIQESGCGECTRAGDIKGLATCFLNFIKRPDLYSECGKKARQYFEMHFTEEKHFAALEHILSGMIGDSL